MTYDAPNTVCRWGVLPRQRFSGSVDSRCEGTVICEPGFVFQPAAPMCEAARSARGGYVSDRRG
jgi:hypothetical protein